MADFSEKKSGLDAISNKINTNKARIARIRELAANASDELDAMAVEYGPLITAIDTDAAAKPSDLALQLQKSEKNHLVAEFMALQAEARAIEQAVTG